MIANTQRGPYDKNQDKLYLILVDLYLQTNKAKECQSVINTLEERLESVSSEDDYAYTIMNELANVLRKHNNYELSA